MRLTYKAQDQRGKETGTVWYAITAGGSIFPKSDREEQALKKLAAYEDADEEGRLVILPCNIGDKVRDKIADHVFTIETVELGHKAGTLFRCGNPGTDDYAALYDFEIGEKIEVLPRAEAEAAIAPPRAVQTPYWLRYRSPSDVLPGYSIIPPQLGGKDE